MNKENLQRMADYIKTIPQEKFDMGLFRDGDRRTHECNSVGCIIGNCTILDNEPLPRYNDGSIDFQKWSINFTGITNTHHWNWLFGGSLRYIDNTTLGASKRIEHYIKNGLPDNWREIMYGSDPLPY